MMSTTITGQYMGSVEKDSHDDTVRYLSKIGMNFASGIDDLVLMIEVRDMPEIISALTEVSQYDHFLKDPTMRNRADEVWDISRISDAGVSLYVTNWQPADGVVFVPRENIIAIHTLSKEFVAKRSDIHRVKAAGHK